VLVNRKMVYITIIWLDIVLIVANKVLLLFILIW